MKFSKRSGMVCVVIVCVVAFLASSAYAQGSRPAMNKNRGIMSYYGRGGFTRSCDQGACVKNKKPGLQSQTAAGNQEMRQGVAAIKAGFKAQRTDLQKQIGDARDARKAALNGERKAFFDKVKTLVGEGKGGQILQAVKDYVGNKQKIMTEAKEKIAGLQSKLKDLGAQERKAIQAFCQSCRNKPSDTPGTGNGNGSTTPPSGNYDYGDSTSATLATKAWDALKANDLAAVQAYTAKAIELYKATALEQQASLNNFAPSGQENQYWALNDVATSYYILAEAQKKAGNTAEARSNYQYITANLKYAQCWDPQGWYWKVAEAAQTALNSL
jgi:hypothetical protein